MDSKRFDQLARVAAAGVPRRAAVRTLLAGIGLSSLVGLNLPNPAAADTTCKGTGQKCNGPGTQTKCCSQRCQNGVCACRDKGGRCAFDTGCCSGRCGYHGRCL